MSPEGPDSLPRRVAKGLGGSQGRLAGLGIEFAAAIALFGLGGYLLDGRLGTRPWLLVVGIFLGAAAGFVRLVRTVFPSAKDPPPRSGSTPG
ncbi:MAG TPA: AtpZ/AtpI family protein [Planctomycetota bacterium]|nr:AtpZ/AtpI family protein [Planctomycetota bacterium]